MKPGLAKPAVLALIRQATGRPARALERLTEGMESQAFRFRIDGDWLVLRINPSLRGFRKDEWAARHVSENVPVPQVVTMGMTEGNQAYCISEWLPGQTLEDLSVEDVSALIPELLRLWRNIGATDVSGIDGFGDFDPEGHGAADTWRQVLEKTLHDARRDLCGKTALGLQDTSELLLLYERLIASCGEQRGLIHGDFGSNNVLTGQGRITGILDWDLAMVGDSLYDVANVYFWASWLPCMEVLAEAFTQIMSDVAAYGERLLCYAIRIGLEEARESVAAGNAQMSSWAVRRTFELADTGGAG
jgi:hygromycin-B 4-O-kinase